MLENETRVSALNGGQEPPSTIVESAAPPPPSKKRLSTNAPPPTAVWVPDDESVWRRCAVLMVDQVRRLYHIRSERGDSTISVRDTHPVDPSHLLDLDNCCYMNNMHEAPLLDLLKRRYLGTDINGDMGEMKIYTNSGDVVISLNPYCNIAGLYERPERYLTVAELVPQVERAREATLSDAVVRRSSINRLLKDVVGFNATDCSSTKNTREDLNVQPERTPHVYSCANRALNALLATAIRQVPSRVCISHKEDIDRENNSVDEVTLDGRKVAVVKNQSIIISGESGAGKTEASKHVLNFLMAANASVEEAKAAAANTVSGRVEPASFQLSLDVLSRVELSARRVQANRVQGANYGQSNQYCSHQYQRLQLLLLHSSVVLEAFGNAKTVRNDNSSRFGKYIKLLYGIRGDEYGKVPALVSAATDTFLLEKSRLANVAPGERNYHIFYQMIRGMRQHEEQLFSKLQLKSDPECFHGLISAGSVLVDCPVDDNAEFVTTLQALKTIQCSAEEVEHVWTLLSCLLHLMNVECFEGADFVSDDNDDSDLVQFRSETMELEGIAQHLGVEYHDMLRCLRTQVMKVMNRASINVKKLSPSDVHNNILALVKWIYSRLFEWLVQKMNCAHSSANGDSEKGDAEEECFIGILDIFGFEILSVNSFEQLCINFTNERLQQQFNEYVFITEQQMYSDEGLEWNNITFKDNQFVIDLIGGTRRPEQQQGGLLLILEEHGLLNRTPDDKALLNQYNKIYGLQSRKSASEITAAASDAFATSKFGNESFMVKHFAGNVEYQIEGFLSKNNDSLQDDLMYLLSQSKNAFLSNILRFGPPDTAAPGYVPTRSGSAEQESIVAQQYRRPGGDNIRSMGKKMASSVTVSQKFRLQLDNLMNTLRKTKPHYIKCIKPNSLKKARILDEHLVIQQLRYSGVLEVVRIRREGFPIRIPFQQFYQNYEIFAAGKSKDLFPGPDKCSDDQLRDCCVKITEIALQQHQYQIGHSMVFLRDNGLEEMQLAIKRFLGLRTAKLQAKYRGILVKRQFLTQRNKVIICQSFMRMTIDRKKFLRMRRAAMSIQWLVAGQRLRKDFKLRYARILEERRIVASTRIQCLIRSRSAYKTFLLKKELQAQRRLSCALRMQQFFRMLLGKRKLRQLRDAGLKLHNFLIALHRGRIARLWYRSVLSALIKLQALARMMRSCSLYKSNIVKIIIIQSILRRKLAYRMAAYIRSVIMVQSVVRQWHARRRASYLSAVIFIQSCVRGHLTRLFAHKLRASICLQRSIRGNHARRFVRGLRAVVRLQSMVRGQKAKKLLLLHFKARYIQREVRGWIVYRRYKEQQYAVICVQSFLRMIVAMWRYAHLQKSLLKIQTFVRFIMKQCHYNTIKKSVVSIQKIVRGGLARIKFEDVIVAVILIQSFVRRALAQQKFEDCIFATVTLQAAIRGRVCCKRYMETRRKIVKIQSAARTYLAKQLFEEQIYAAIVIQSFARRIIAQQRYDESIFAIITMQAIFRGAAIRIMYTRTRRSIIVIQSLVRGKLARLDMDSKVFAIVSLQAFGRMIIAQSRYMLNIICILVLQSFARMIMARRPYLRQRVAAVLIECCFRSYRARYELMNRKSAILKIQSIVRMGYARRYLIVCLASAISIQSHVRAYLHQSRFLFFVFAVVVLQSHIRKFSARRKLQRLRRAAITTARYVRGYQRRKRYMQLLGSVHRLGRAMLAYRRYTLTRRGILLLHYGLRGRKQFEGVELVDSILHYVQVSLARNPHEKSVRCRWFRYCTVFHSALLGGDVRILKLLNLGCKDVLAVDADGRNSAHYLAMNPLFFNMRLFAAALNEYRHRTDVVLHALLDDDDEENSEKAQHEGHSAEGSERHTELKRALSTSVGRDTLLAGWIKKKRGGLMWQRRWAVLTEDYIVYYKNPDSMSQPKFAIPLVGLTVQRLPGKEPVLEITSPTMANKKSFFGTSNKKSILFLMDSEMELQEWLMPLKALAGIGSLRPAGSNSPPVRYVNMALRELWVCAVDKEGNTALHVAAMLIERTEKGGNEDSVRIICWFLENGLDVNARNSHGETALHICMKAARGQRGRMLILCLAMKGADIRSIKDNDGNTVAALLVANDSLDQEMKGYYAQVFDAALKGSPSSSLEDIHLKVSSSSAKGAAPPLGSNNHSTSSEGSRESSVLRVRKLKGYSYLSFFIGRLLILDARAAKWDKPCLSFSVYNKKGQVLEEKCTLRHPPVSSVDKLRWPDENYSAVSPGGRRGSEANPSRRGSATGTPRRRLGYLDLWWGNSWHMHTPLENIEEGSFVLVQLQKELNVNSGSGKVDSTNESSANNDPVYWTRFPIDVDIIQSSVEDMLPLNFIESSANLLYAPPGTRISQRTPPLFLTAPVAAPLHQSASGTSTGGGGNRSQQYSTATVSHITVDCILHHLDRRVDFHSVLKS